MNSAIANAMIYGDGRQFNICIIVPDFLALEGWIKGAGLENNSSSLIKNQAFIDHVVNQAKEQLQNKFGGYEIPKKFIIIDEDFTLENGMLTQTMKLKRRNVVEKYKGQIETLYAD